MTRRPALNVSSTPPSGRMSRAETRLMSRLERIAPALGLALLLTASLAARTQHPEPQARLCRVFSCTEAGIVRGRLDRKEMALIFTGGDFADGGLHIRRVLKEHRVKASFFFTGDFYRSPEKKDLIRGLKADGHYLGPHSDKHLLYCDWDDRGKTLVTREKFRNDILANYRVMQDHGIALQEARYFIPPYEWYNRGIVRWAEELGLVLFNFTPGTASNADYTTPSMPEYRGSETIYNSIINYERSDPHGFNGFILLIHIGTAPERTDKLYTRLDDLLDYLAARGYSLVRVDELLDPSR